MDAELKNILREELQRCLEEPVVDLHHPRLIDLYFCYRLLLARTPEFDGAEAYRRHRGGADLHGLIRSFVWSAEFRAHWTDVVLPLPPDIPVMAELTDGLRLFFYPRDRALGIHAVLGRYEPEMQRAIGRLARPGMVCIDAGANIGFFSLLMGRAVRGSGGRVYAFEPWPAAHRLLIKNIAENGLGDVVIPLECAVHERPGTNRLYYQPDDANENLGGMFLASAPDAPVTRGHACVEVRQVCIDDALPSNARVALVKMDVEGSEPFALRGMEAIIRRARPVLLVEFNSSCLREMGGIEPPELLRELRGYGYRVSTVERFVAGSMDEFEPGSEDVVVNLACLPRE